MLKGKNLLQNEAINTEEITPPTSRLQFERRGNFVT